MLWSIIPEEMVFAAADETPWQERQYRGCRVLLRPDENGMGEIMSVISSNPRHYLDQSLQLGMKIPLM